MARRTNESSSISVARRLMALGLSVVITAVAGMFLAPAAVGHAWDLEEGSASSSIDAETRPSGSLGSGAAQASGVYQDEPTPEPEERPPTAYLPLVTYGITTKDIRRPWPQVFPIDQLESSVLQTRAGTPITLGGQIGPGTVVLASHPLSTASRNRLEVDPTKLDHLLDNSPEGVEYVYMHYQGTEDLFDDFESVLNTRLDEREDGDLWRERIHLVEDSVEMLEAADTPLHLHGS